MSIASQLSFSTATSLLAGAAGSIPYQASVSNSTFLAIGTNGYVLTSNGSVPTWTIASGVTSGTATNAINILTVLTATNASYYPTFVSANNAAPGAYMPQFTTSTFVINPYTGNVGIGTSSPAVKLDVSGAFAVSTNANGVLPSTTPGGLVISQNYGGGTAGTAEIDFFYNDSTYVGDNGGFRFYQKTGASTAQEMLRLTQNTVISYTGGTERMRINSSGNVGIGTSSPSYPLHISSSTGQVYLVSSVGTNYVRYSANNTGGSFQFGIDNSAGSNFFGATSYGRAIFSDGAYPVGIFTNGTLRISITANGGVSFGASGTAYGTSGQILQSNGDAPPTWVSTGSLVSGNSVAVQTVLTATNATFYPSFVSTNNATPAALFHYTTSTFTINPNTGVVIHGGTVSSTSTTTGALQVYGGIGVGGSVYVGNRIGFVNTAGNASVVYQFYNTATNSLDTVFG